MPSFYALVDAMTGRESEVERGLMAHKGVLAVTRMKEKNFDFLIRFDAPAFDKVDEFLQTEVRRIAGIAGVEIIVDLADHSHAVREAAAKLG